MPIVGNACICAPPQALVCTMFQCPIEYLLITHGCHSYFGCELCVSLLHSLSISYQSNTAKQCLDEIVNIQPKDSSGGGGETREAVVSRQAADMLEKLPSGYIPHEVLTCGLVLWCKCTKAAHYKF